jgi:peptidyl-prolyl cis-trans isomerase A (cyclophilin A)
MDKLITRLIPITLSAMFCLTLMSACQSNQSAAKAPEAAPVPATPAPEPAPAAHREPQPVPVPTPVPMIRISMLTTKGEIILELDRAHAPISVDNFLEHANRGDYNGTCFHRVIPTFVIQGGGWTPDLKERAKADEAAGRKDAAIKNEWTNGLKNLRGTIAMARDAAPDTATREFYINVADNSKLDSPREKTGNAGYAVFGRVVQGMEVVDVIKNGKTMPRPDVISDGEGLRDVPVEPVVILKVVRVMGP